MEQHLNFHHSQYAHPGKYLGDLLPANAAAAVLLTPLEEARLGIPTHPEFTLVTPSANETTLATSKHRAANVAMFTTAVASSSKHPH